MEQIRWVGPLEIRREFQDGGYIRASALCELERGFYRSPEARRVIVARIERDPGNRSPAALRPVAEQCRPSSIVKRSQSLNRTNIPSLCSL